MISREEIENLAELSRLQLSDEEIHSLQKEFSAILDYVGQISNASGERQEAIAGELQLQNVMRDDVVEGAPKSSREMLLAAAPRREGDYIVVRKIIEKDVQ